MYDFDTLIDRRNSESTKWDRFRFQCQDENMLPLWLADMDVAVSDAIQEALIDRARHPIYGYSDRGPQYPKLFADRFNERFDYDIDPTQVVLSTGVMYSISGAIRLFTKPHDGILIMRPCYHPFVDMTINNDRNPIFVDMVDEEDGYRLNLEAFNEAASKCTALILCNPHNPTGRVFTREELSEIASICQKHSLLIISDEIHCDFTYKGFQFYPIMNISDYTKEHTISCVAPTKSFNLAGLKVSAAFIKNKEMLEAFKNYAKTSGIASINLFAMEALKQAYLNSAKWQEELLAYLEENRMLIDEFLKEFDQQIRWHCPEGTYFYWLRFLDDEAFIHKELLKHHLALSEGSEFGETCIGFERLNFACPKSQLRKALEIIKDVLRERKCV